MSTDVRNALDEIAAQAQGAVRAVDLDRLRSRVRRRRTQGAVVRSVGGLAVVGVVAASLTLLGDGPVPAPAEVPVATATPTPSTTPSAGPTTALPGWVPGGAPCGSVFALEPVDHPELEVQGSVMIGTLDRQTAMFGPDPAGSGVYLNVFTTSEVPGQPAGGDGTSDLTTVLVDDEGTVAFWSDPARLTPRVESADGQGSSVSNLYDAVDCRTGRPLVGTYRVFAHEANGPETVELAPVTFGPNGTRPPNPFLDVLPVCGQPVPDVVRDFTVALDPAVVLDDVDDAGLHLPVTVTSADPGRLRGRVPQSLHAVLVDADGIVVTEAFDRLVGRHDSGAAFDVRTGGSFPAEVFTWFRPCGPTPTGTVGSGAYDLYVYDVFLADDGSGVPTPRTAAGGPFPLTVRER